jgi:hypothetical protein
MVSAKSPAACDCGYDAAERVHIPRIDHLSRRMRIAQRPSERDVD